MLTIPLRPAPSFRQIRLDVAVVALVPLLMTALIVAKAAGLLGFSGSTLVIIGLRLAVPLLILRYWLVGGMVAMLLDAADVIIIDSLPWGGFKWHGGNDIYAELDKALDSYYYILEVLVAWRWANPWMRVPAVLLFGFRVAGAALFEIVDARIILFVFPNLFENWWLYCVVVAKWFPRAVPNDWKSMWIPLVALLVPKMAQEYLLHVMEATPWSWTKDRILDPIGIHP